MKRFVLLLLVNAAALAVLAVPCAKRHIGNHSSFVCVCNATYCDTLEDGTVEPHQLLVFTSDQAENRFKSKKINVKEAVTGSEDGQVVRIDRNKSLQSIVGFGGAFTDAGGLNMLKLGPKLSEQIIDEYFGPNGLRYNLGRVPIGGADFSTRPYTYDDADFEDFNLTNFKLAPDDYQYKIPFIKLAEKKANHSISLMCTPWSPPTWMKTNGKLNGKGSIKGETNGEYYKTWANYLIKFLDEYKKNGIDFSLFTIQNEPNDGTIDDFEFNCNGMTPEIERDFLFQTLGPALHKAGYGKDKLKIFILDDDRPWAKQWADVILTHPEASKYVTGIAFHWYLDSMTAIDALDQVYETYNGYPLLMTEACEGSNPVEPEAHQVVLGDWGRAENIAYDMIQNFQHYTSGWIDWNLALDMDGGPNWSNNTVDAPIIINDEAMEYFKQPMYYTMAHFSRFLPPGSVQIAATTNDELGLSMVAFVDPQDTVVLIVLNRYKSTIPLTIIDTKLGKVSLKIGPKSLQTILFK